MNFLRPCSQTALSCFQMLLGRQAYKIHSHEKLHFCWLFDEDIIVLQADENFIPPRDEILVKDVQSGFRPFEPKTINTAGYLDKCGPQHGTFLALQWINIFTNVYNVESMRRLQFILSQLLAVNPACCNIVLSFLHFR